MEREKEIDREDVLLWLSVCMCRGVSRLAKQVKEVTNYTWSKKGVFFVCVIPLTFISKSKVGGREADYTLEKV
jgi:hypothetical protein